MRQTVSNRCWRRTGFSRTLTLVQNLADVSGNMSRSLWDLATVRCAHDDDDNRNLTTVIQNKLDRILLSLHEWDTCNTHTAVRDCLKLEDVVVLDRSSHGHKFPGKVESEVIPQYTGVRNNLGGDVPFTIEELSRSENVHHPASFTQT